MTTNFQGAVSEMSAHAEVCDPSARAEASISPDSNFHRQALDALDQERERLAHDLHDAVGTELIIAKMGLQACFPKPADLAQGLSPDQVAKLAAKLESARAQLDSAYTAVRRIVHGIGTEAIGAVGLIATVRGLLGRTWPQESGISARVIEDGSFPSLPALDEVKIFRFVEGTLSNVGLYAQTRYFSDGVSSRASTSGSALRISKRGP